MGLMADVETLVKVKFSANVPVTVCPPLTNTAWLKGRGGAEMFFDSAQAAQQKKSGNH
jgi:hypothetical protein